ncbi:hypothetical protein MJG53_018430 [Ovis ammon polii x Ovis aries]|uniref:Uncharacterized protein n=2 Tax=Ovis TaxID=9935 RepID=A0A836CS16_SHEEP|nr:hypothetical protein JEQ12_012793 [Ovis aries]KAI4559904.1 hypothetical protein MJG53_018430 [Ovis ammon polii x Ovis aries]
MNSPTKRTGSRRSVVLRISKFYRYVNICSQCQLSLFVSPSKVFPLVRLGRGRDRAFFLFLERPPPQTCQLGFATYRIGTACGS